MSTTPVEPHSFIGWNCTPLQIFGIGPKFTIVCGKCFCTFKRRIEMMNQPVVKCPDCGTPNMLPLQRTQV